MFLSEDYPELLISPYEGGRGVVVLLNTRKTKLATRESCWFMPMNAVVLGVEHDGRSS
jgi:hypothetical protein